MALKIVRLRLFEVIGVAQAVFFGKARLLGADLAGSRAAPVTASCRPPARRKAGLAVLLALVLTGSAQAQWAWRDANGEMTYSDSPPPADIQRSDIVQQPNLAAPPSTGVSGAAPGAPGAYSGTGGPTAASPSNGSAPAAPAAQPASRASAAPKTLAEQEADFRKRLADQQKGEQQQADQEVQDAKRADACNQAKTYMDMLQGGTRLLRPDANGQRNFLDDDQRSAEIQKTQEIIDKNC